VAAGSAALVALGAGAGATVLRTRSLRLSSAVLAGAIEFSPAEIALIVAVLIAASLVVTSPGWVVLSFVMGRRPAPGATPGKRWWARIGGALAGCAISAAAVSLVGSVIGFSLILSVPIAWGACWALAALLHRRAPAPVSAAPVPSPGGPGQMPPPAPPATGEGWGR
ncbi:MAG: hypothetical protein LH461_08745, partial [Spirochaetaceae bacterium]|nr:hypothetical protein [Spirochaetaceae bacterium]